MDPPQYEPITTLGKLGDYSGSFKGSGTTQDFWCLPRHLVFAHLQLLLLSAAPHNHEGNVGVSQNQGTIKGGYRDIQGLGSRVRISQNEGYL